MITPPALPFKRPEAGPSKSLTPQRKHRKLLKDGSGSEVWPESIEKIFVDGLRAYRQSPFLSYSRGRSRYRNQFLVDYLYKAGISRTKKQVASHIQVLRNMWKGEPEFHLVAGGEELFADGGALSSVKFEDRGLDSTDLVSFDYNDYDSNNTSPDYSPPDLKYEFPPSPVVSLGAQFTPSSTSSHSLPSQRSSPDMIPSHVDLQYPLVYPDTHRMSPYTLPQYPTFQESTPNWITAFFLLADGMQPFSVDFDSHIPHSALPSPSWPLTMKTKLYIPPGDSGDPGFVASISLASTFVSATCITQVFHDQTRVHCESGVLLPSPTNQAIGGSITAFLPSDGPLAKSRDFAYSSTAITTLTQQIIVDDQTLLYAVHVLLRGDGGTTPSATLVGCRPYQDNSRRNSNPASSSQQHKSASTSSTSTTANQPTTVLSYTTSIPLYQPATASISEPYASTTASPAYALTSSAPALTNYSYSPALSSHSTGSDSAFSSSLSAVPHPYTSGYSGTTAFGSAATAIQPSMYRRTSLSHALSIPNIPIC